MTLLHCQFWFFRWELNPNFSVYDARKEIFIDELILTRTRVQEVGAIRRGHLRVEALRLQLDLLHLEGAGEIETVGHKAHEERPRERRQLFFQRQGQRSEVDGVARVVYGSHSGSAFDTGNTDAVDDGVSQLNDVAHGRFDFGAAYIFALPTKSIAGPILEGEPAKFVHDEDVAGAEEGVAFALDVANDLFLGGGRVADVALEVARRIESDDSTDEFSGFARLAYNAKSVFISHFSSRVGIDFNQRHRH